MQRRIPCLTLLAAVALAPMHSASAAESERARLDKGEIIIKQRAVKGSDMPEAIVKAVIETTPTRVWAILDRCDRYKKVMPRTSASKELSRKGNIIVCKITIDMPFPISDLTATTKAVHTVKKAFWQRAWQLMSGDYKRNTGSWTLKPFDAEGKRTLVVYRVHAEPNISVPVWVQKRASKSTLPDLIAAVAKASGAKQKSR